MTGLCANVDDPTLIAAYGSDAILSDLITRDVRIQLYAGQTTPNFPPRVSGFENAVTYEKLLGVDFYARYQRLCEEHEREAVLMVEAPAIKSWDPQGEQCREWMHRMVAAIRSAGFTGRLVFMMDEPLTWAIPGRYVPEGHSQELDAEGHPIGPMHTIGTVVNAVVPYCFEVYAESGCDVGLIEAWPNQEAWVLQSFAEQLLARGVRLVEFRWDLLPDASIPLTKGTVASIERAIEGMRLAGVESIGVITQPLGTRVTQKDFADSMRRCHSAWTRWFSDALWTETFQSWHAPTGKTQEETLLEMPSFLPVDHPGDPTMNDPRYSLREVLETP